MKFLISLLLFFLFISYSSAYELSKKDQAALDQAKILVWELKDKKNKAWFDKRIEIINSLQETYKKNIRFWLIFTQLKDEFILVSQSFDMEKEIILESENISTEQDFFEKYGKEITTQLIVPERCKTHFEYVDEIAKRNNFPTALIIATWGKETNCNMVNPANGWGIFQITSQYYEPGNIWLIELEQSIEAFIAFSRNKWDYFNNNRYHNLRERFWSETLDITYKNYTLRDLRLHSILYNGIRADTTLEGNTFANNNLNPNVIWPSDGIVTRFLKVLYWKNNK